MRIAVVHSQYSEALPSGENVVVADQVSALRSAGHEVHLFSRSTDIEAKSRNYTFKAAQNVVVGSGEFFSSAVREFNPEIVHVHNLFPNIGWRWLTSIGAPVVNTFHNYRSFCAAGTALRDGKVCVLCPERGSINSLRYKCYRGSAVASLPLAIATRRSWEESSLAKLSAGHIFLSDQMKRQFLQVGKLLRPAVVIPNFVPPSPRLSDEKNGRWVWAGRFTPEKGLEDLLRIWPSGHSLDVFGHGSSDLLMEKTLPPGVKFRGPLSARALRETLPDYNGMVISSAMPGNSVGLVHLEAIAAGLPVVARAGSSSADEVIQSGNGAVFTGHDDLRKGLQSWESSPVTSSTISKRYHSEYSEAAWVSRTLNFYRSILGTSPTVERFTEGQMHARGGPTSEDR